MDEDINRGQLLENIKDFFQSKGSKLGIHTFQDSLGETDVDVFYPGRQDDQSFRIHYIESFIPKG